MLENKFMKTSPYKFLHLSSVGIIPRRSILASPTCKHLGLCTTVHNIPSAKVPWAYSLPIKCLVASKVTHLNSSFANWKNKSRQAKIDNLQNLTFPRASARLNLQRDTALYRQQLVPVTKTMGCKFGLSTARWWRYGKAPGRLLATGHCKVQAEKGEKGKKAI